MATKALSLSDLMKSTTFPAGGFTIANSTPSYVPQPAPNPLTGKPTSSLSQLSITPPANPGITLPPNSPLAGIGSKIAIAPNGSVSPPVIPPAVAPSPSPLFAGANQGGGPTIPGPTGATGAAPIPPQYMNPDGSYKTADQVASDIAGTLKNVHTAPDVGTLTAEQFADPNGGTTADAETRARQIDNTRNDIASGATDPYGVGGSSGIAYTPAELTAIEHAYAGVYDPALDTALAKVNAKQAADQAANQPYTLGKDDVRYNADGSIAAVGIPSTTTTTGTYVAGSDPTADAYVKGVQAGTFKISDVPDAYKNIVAQGLSAATGANAPLSQTSQTAVGIINQLQGLNLDALSGTGAIGAIEHPTSLFPGTDVQNTQNLAKQLNAVMSLANRTQLKGQGAISDFEFRVLQDGATALGLNDQGRTNLSPEAFKDQLQKLEVRLQVGQTKALTDDEVQALSAKGFTPQQIRDYDSTQAGGGGSGKVSVGNTSASAGNIPQRNNNPGDVKAGGIADSLATGKDQYGHLIFATPEDGFKALTADLTAKINGGSSHLPANPTLAQLGSVYAEDPNWGKRVAAMLGVPVSTPTQQIPIASLAQAIAHQEGFYA